MLLNTRMLDEVLAAGPDAVGADSHERMMQAKATGRHAARARRRACGLSSDLAESDGITGRLLSAVWDPWEDLASTSR